MSGIQTGKRTSVEKVAYVALIIVVLIGYMTFLATGNGAVLVGTKAAAWTLLAWSTIGVVMPWRTL